MVKITVWLSLLLVASFLKSNHYFKIILVLEEIFYRIKKTGTKPKLVVRADKLLCLMKKQTLEIFYFLKLQIIVQAILNSLL